MKDADRDLVLYSRAVKAAEAGNARFAAALRSLDGLNVQSQQARSHADRLNQSYAELERAVLDEAEELPE